MITLTEPALVKSYRLHHNFKLYDFDQRRRTHFYRGFSKNEYHQHFDKKYHCFQEEQKIMLASLLSQEDENPKYRPRYTLSQDT